jgi:hypothetical protein
MEGRGPACATHSGRGGPSAALIRAPGWILDGMGEPTRPSPFGSASARPGARKSFRAAPGPPRPSCTCRIPPTSPVRRSARPPAHPHFPQPHCRQEMQPELRTTGPAHSGQTRMLLTVNGLVGRYRVGWRRGKGGMSTSIRLMFGSGYRIYAESGRGQEKEGIRDRGYVPVHRGGRMKPPWESWALPCRCLMGGTTYRKLGAGSQALIV